MADFATVSDINTLWRQMTADETTRATALLPVVSDRLRYEAIMVGRDLDAMTAASAVLTNVAKMVTVDIVARTLMTSTDQEPMTQMAESALGYSQSGTFLIPGGGLFVKDSELKALGLKRQRYGVIEFCGSDSSDGSN